MSLDVDHTIAGLETEVRELRRKIGYVMRANATYSAGHALLHREHDETRQQLLLAMRWGAEQSRELDRIEGDVVEISNDFRAERDAIVAAADQMRGWLVAARVISEERGAKPGTLAELDAILAMYDGARGVP